jgi:hypothetical protein
MRVRSSGAVVFTSVVCSLLLFSVLDPGLVTAASTTTSTTAAVAPAPVLASPPASIVLTIVPPKLPADGGSYPAIVVSLLTSAGKPSLAANDTLVFLTSSQASVGSVSGRVTISKGSGFAVANFTSSTTPGSTSISASSVGLSAASSQVATVNPSGLATRLKVIPVPGSQLVNPSATGTVLVETLDSAGFPAKASSSVIVTLSSSNNNVVKLPSTSLTIASGSVLSSARYDIGFAPGMATITGSASGFNSGSGTVTVQGPSPLALKIFALPTPITTSAGGILVVTLTDAQGSPARAPSSIQVAISSSNTTIVSSDRTATISTGQIYALAAFASSATPGSANLTTSSPGLKSDFAIVSVAKPSQPVKLKLIVAPNPVLADTGAYNSIMVELTDASGTPAVASSDVAVTLSSSNAAVGSVGGSLTILAGASYALAPFASTFFVGSTSITALAQNLQSTSATVSSYGPIPSKVLVLAVPAILPADGRDYSALEVMLVDSNGSPAVAPVGIPVQLASSRTDIAMVNSTVVIGAGQNYLLTDVVTTISPGVANVTASSSGFDSSSTGFSTTSPAPSQLGVYIAPASGIQSVGGGGDAVLAVQLQDSNSSPARARQQTTIVVTGSNGSVTGKPLQFEIPAGGDYAWAMMKTSAPGSSVLTASTSGLASASGSISEISLPLSVTLTSSSPSVTMGATASLQLQVQVGGSPLKGANVTLQTTSGSVSPAQGLTDGAGQFSAIFTPQRNGVAIITALVQHPLLGNQSVGTNVLVSLPGGTGSVGSTSGGLGAAGYLLPVAIVAVVVVIMVLGVRRIVKSRRAVSDDGEFPGKDPE